MMREKFIFQLLLFENYLNNGQTNQDLFQQTKQSVCGPMSILGKFPSFLFIFMGFLQNPSEIPIIIMSYVLIHKHMYLYV